jgi:putative hydrolase of the HAD superfamily
MVQAVIFDCFGVLATGTWRQFLDSLPPDVDFVQLHSLNNAHDAGLVADGDFEQQVIVLTGKPPPSLDDMSPLLQKNQPLLEFIRDDVKPLVRVGMLSNVASDWVRTSLLDADECALFDDMVFSFEVGMAKPNPEIFVLAAERLGLAPDQCAYIDDIASFVAAAKDVGFRAHHYQGLHELRDFLRSLMPPLTTEA